jgi:hypothetical protein
MTSETRVPIEVSVDRGESLLVPEVTQGLVNVVNENIANSFESAAMVERNFDIGDAESNTARGKIQTLGSNGRWSSSLRWPGPWRRAYLSCSRS